MAVLPVLTTEVVTTITFGSFQKIVQRLLGMSMSEKRNFNFFPDDSIFKETVRKEEIQIQQEWYQQPSEAINPNIASSNCKLKTIGDGCTV